MLKKFISLMLAFVFVFAAVPTSANDLSYDYIALGDSIARGYGLSNPKTASYPAQFAAKKSLTHINYGVDGMTADELLAALQNDEYDLGGAKVITVSIGSNNLLDMLIGAIAEECGIDETMTDDVPQAISNYAKALIDKGYTDILANHYKNLKAELQNNLEIYAECDRVKNDLIPAIAAEIREQNPDAQLIFTNIYNPYKGMDVIVPLSDNGTATEPIGPLFQPYVNRINSGFESTDDYIVCDIATVFSGRTDYVNAHLDLRDTARFSYDPHPTFRGHTAIANAVAELYTAPEPTTETTTEAATETSTETTTEATTEETTETTTEAIIYGDMNKSKAIEAADAAIVLQYTLNKSAIVFDDTDKVKADVDGNNRIDAEDAAHIMQKALVSTYRFPVFASDGSFELKIRTE